MTAEAIKIENYEFHKQRRSFAYCQYASPFQLLYFTNMQNPAKLKSLTGKAIKVENYELYKHGLSFAYCQYTSPFSAFIFYQHAKSSLYA